MLNIRELEKRWRVYKLKSYVPHAIISISLLIIVSLSTLFIREGDTFNPKPKEKINFIPKEIKSSQKIINKPITPIKKDVIILQKEPISKPIITDTVTLKLKPSLGFMKKIQNSTLPYYQAEPSYNNMIIDMNKRVVIQKKETPKKPSLEPVTIISKKELTKKNKITIERRNTRDDIHNIIKRFKKNNNPALSLFIAKKYYELGEYHKSYNYALITNQINRDIEASWIVFSKSLMKLGEKEMAVKTLREYIKSSHSSNAKLLLEDINSGKFR